VIAARDRGLKTKQVADLFHFRPARVRRVMQRLREHGESSPRPRGGVTLVKVDKARLRGRAPRGERLIDKSPHGHWKTTTLIAALGIEGMRCSTVVDTPVNADLFEAFAEQVLAPQLVPGDVLIMASAVSSAERTTRPAKSVPAHAG
jgi:hypothetical protein